MFFYAPLHFYRCLNVKLIRMSTFQYDLMKVMGREALNVMIQTGSETIIKTKKVLNPYPMILIMLKKIIHIS